MMIFRCKIKKVNIIKVLLIFLSTMLISCSDEYINWQSVSVSGVGTFKVPQEWIVTKSYNFLIIKDEFTEKDGGRTYLVGIIRVDDGKWYYDFSDYNFFENVVHVGNADYGKIYSNNARYWVEYYNINDIVQKKYVIQFRNPGKEINLLVMDSLIDKDMIIKITKSFVVDRNVN